MGKNQSIPTTSVVLVTAIAMVAFAGNSLLCRVALSATAIDPASFTAIRLASGAITLGLLVLASRKPRVFGGNWLSALALFTYAAGFSFAYISLPAATGALLLFSAVQCTMIGYGYFKGERMSGLQMFGVAVAVAGMVGLLLPGLSAPPIAGTALMLAAGMSWGIYSLRGRAATDATLETAGNFVRAVPLALLVSVALFKDITFDVPGMGYAVASGALASGVGYAIWYTALRSLAATSAAIVQLSVPGLTAAGGMALLDEPMSMRLLLASAAILGGIAVYILSKGRTLGARKKTASDV